MWYIIDDSSCKRELVVNLTNEQLLYFPWRIWDDVVLIEFIEEFGTLDNWY